MNSTVGIVVTPEVQFQDARERGQLSTTYYPTLRDVPPTPSEEGTRVVDPTGSRWIAAPPLRFPIPPLQHQQPYNPYGWQQPQTHQPQQHHQWQNTPLQHQPQPQGWGANPTFNPYLPQPPTNPVPSPYGAGTGAGTSSYRPRNGTASPAPNPAATSSAYRPRANSVPSAPTNEASRPGFERGQSVPSAPTQPQVRQLQVLPPSGNPEPIPDRARINHTWRKDIRPRKSALHNPLSASEVAENQKRLAAAPPHDYGNIKMEEEEPEDGDKPVLSFAPR